MPNRIIKESVCTSESIDGLSWFEEVFFYRLIVNCDDFGRFDARPAVLKSRLFPLKERITLKEVSNALTKLADAGIVRLYECDSKPYLYLPTWEVHQTPRAKKSKYPDPADGVNASEIICKQTQADAPDIRYSIFENDTRYSGNDIRDDSAEPGALAPSAAPEPAVFITIPLNDGSEFAVTDGMINEWRELYPAVDVEQQLRSMRAWTLSNPTKRKTKSGIKRFINSWLSREQDKGGLRPTVSQQQPPRGGPKKSKSYAEIAQDIMDGRLGEILSEG